MRESKKIFLAASAFVAFIDRAHPKHTQVAAYFRYFSQAKYQLYTGYLNIEEAYSKIFQDISPSLAKDFLRAVALGSINIIYPTESDMKAAIKALVTSQSSELTFKDAQMEVLAYKNNISQICTFDYLPPLFGLTAFYLPV